jgi:diguanylate cyclase (GGDEF)-like protein/PAS domain S-box-containing protein
LRTFIDAQDDLVYLKDENFKYVFVNKAFKKFYGKKSSEIIGKTDYDISEKEFADVVRKNDIEALEKMTKKKSISKKDKVILESIKFPVKLLTNKIGIGTTARDVTEDVERINKIEYLSFRDSLTGLYNRRFAEEEIQRLDTDRNLPISVIIGDVNGLKLTNDVFGHHAGDALLKKVAETIKSSCRSDDIVARWGGDEFLVLLPKTGLEETEEICNRINEKLNEEKVKSIKCSISLGRAVKENVDKRIILVLEEAEDNMYSDKTLKKSNGKGEIIKSILTEFHKKFYREKVHSLEMKRIIEIFGKKLNLTKSELKVLEELSLYHDIGKISIDKEILDKKNPLIKSEWNEIKQHPVTGYRILNAYEDTFELASYLLSHHERWDGLGYPKGLKGKEIPKLSRVLAIVESYEVMSSEMSYVKMIDREKIIEEIENNYGKQFDPYLAKIFVEMIRNDEIKKIT